MIDEQGGASRTLGLGLIAAGAGLGALVVLWLIVNAISGQLRGGGFVLGLLIAAIFTLPLVLGGAYLMRRSTQEAKAAGEFAERSRLLDADRLVRGELARTLADRRERIEALQLRTPDPALVEAAARLRALERSVERPAYAVEPAWYSAVRLEDDDLAAVRRYDDLVLDQAHQLATRFGDAGRGERRPADLLPAVGRLEKVWQERNDLLLRGRRAVRAGELLGTPDLGTARLDPAALNLGDAVSYEAEDYLVQAKLDYFAGDRTWTMLRLVQTKLERWLLIGPAPGSLAWLEAAQPEAVAGLKEIDAGTATVTVATPGRTERGIFVEYHRLQAPTGVAWLERWPDHQRAYQGQPIRPDELQLWPRQTEQPS